MSLASDEARGTGAPPEAGASPPLRVLVLDPGGSVISQVRAALDDGPERDAFALVRAATLPAALERARDERDDVALLPLTAEGLDLATLLTLRAEAPALPVVVICSAESEPLALKAVQLGAVDYLVLGRFYGTAISRALRHAVEVERVRAALAQYHADWPPSLAGGATTRAASLRAAFPDQFAALVRAYGEILDVAVEGVLQRRRPELDPQLERIAAEALALLAGPRDVVEVHAAAMKKRETECGPQRMQVYLAEGRVRLLELMGRLMAQYRDRWLAAQRPAPY